MDGNTRDLIEAIGILSFAVTGMVVARSKGVNAAGTFLIALFAGLGGGTLRDIMLDVRPFLWERQPLYPIIIFLLSLGYAFWPQAQRFLSQPKNLVIGILEVLAAASLGLGGADKALSLGQVWLNVAIYGVISGSFGGLMRDVLANDVPVLFRPGLWLAGALLIGCLAFATLTGVGVNSYVASTVGAALIIGIRLTAVLRERREKALAQAQQATTPQPS